MKKLLLAIALLTLGMSANAQWITSLDEMAMLGKWEVTAISGTFPEFQNEYRSEYPIWIEFNNRKSTNVAFTDNNGNETIEQYAGYWIGGTTTGHYTLHLLYNRQYNSTYTGMSLQNFVIGLFDSNQMTLRTFDNSGSINLRKVANESAVRSVPADSIATSRAYRVDGTPATDDTKGVVIQNGKKAVRK